MWLEKSSRILQWTEINFFCACKSRRMTEAFHFEVFLALCDFSSLYRKVSNQFFDKFTQDAAPLNLDVPFEFVGLVQRFTIIFVIMGLSFF